MTYEKKDYADAPPELQGGIAEFWPEEEWDNAASVAFYESGWDAFAVNDTTTAQFPCNSVIGMRDGIRLTAERSVGFFQINACNFPGWEWQRLYNTRHNCGTAHLLWDLAGRSWRPWFFTAKELGLIL